MQSEDIILWPNGTWCLGEDSEDMTHMSDDFRVIPFNTLEWDELYSNLVPTCEFCGYFTTDCSCEVR